MPYFELLIKDILYEVLKYLDFLQILDQHEQYEGLYSDENFWYKLANVHYNINKNQFNGLESIIYSLPLLYKIYFDSTVEPYLKYLQLHLQLPIDLGNGMLDYPNTYRFGIDLVKTANLDLIKYVLKLNINYLNKTGAAENFIHEAATTGKIDIVSYFLDLAKDVPRGHKGYQWCLNNALTAAADSGKLELIDHLISLGAQADVFDRAAIYDQTQVLKVFYDKTQPNVDQVNYALHWVKQTENIVFLLSKGANPDIALSKLAHNGALNEIKKILEYSKIESKYIDESLLSAVIGDHIDVVRYLLTYSPANIDDATKYAVEGEHLDTVKILLPLTTLSKQRLFNLATMHNEDIEVVDYLYNISNVSTNNSSIDLNQTLLELVIVVITF